MNVKRKNPSECTIMIDYLCILSQKMYTIYRGLGTNTSGGYRIDVVKDREHDIGGHNGNIHNR